MSVDGCAGFTHCIAASCVWFLIFNTTTIKLGLMLKIKLEKEEKKMELN